MSRVPTRSDVPGLEELIDQSNYPGPRKRVLKELYDNGDDITFKLLYCDAFQKDEGYSKPKMPRGIMSYSDMSKLIFSPIFKAVDEFTFKHKWFVKGMDVSERPYLLFNAFGSRPVVETDFTSFECHHRGVFSEIVYYWIMHMTRGLDLPGYLKRMLAVAVRKDNIVRFNGCKFQIPQTLMSGALWTSSSNGLLNLLIMSYLNTYDESLTGAAQAEKAFNSFNGFVEGDDGICEHFRVRADVIDRLGILLKFDECNNYGEASFCGIVCPVGANYTLYDPIKFLRNFYWLPNKFYESSERVQDAYLRAKALSYLYQFPKCPVVSELCFNVCERTRGVNIRDNVLTAFDSYKLNEINKAIENATTTKFHTKKPEIPDEARLHVSRKFKITVEEQKQFVENTLTGKPVDLSEWMMPDDMHNMSYHVTDVPQDVPLARNFMPKELSELIKTGTRGKRINPSRNKKSMLGKWSPSSIRE